MKKILSAAIAVCIVLSALPVFAANEQAAEILAVVKERVEIPAELNEFSSAVNEYGDSASYRFCWSSDKGNLTISCSDEKIITSYRYYREDDFTNGKSEPSFPKTDSDTLKKAAQAFINKLNPELEVSVIGENTALYGNTAYFDLQRTEDGIPIAGMNGYIEISVSDTEVRGMRLPYVSIESFDGYNDRISPDDAKKAFTSKLGFEPVYLRTYTDEKYSFFPAYINDNGNKYISAVSGEVIEYNPYSEYNSKNDSLSAADTAEAGSGGSAESFSPEERFELDKIENLLSKEQIENKMRTNKLISIPEAYELRSASLHRRADDENAYMYSLSFSDGEHYMYGCADAKTGEIYIMHAYENWEDLQPAEPEDIEEAIALLTPSLKDKYKYDGKRTARYENGIRVYSDYITAYTDKNGKIAFYNVNYTRNAEFIPLGDNPLSPAHAAEKIFDYGGYSLKYIVNEDRKAYLVYDTEQEITLSAITGKSVGYDGSELSDGTYEYTDIENHYAKEYIEMLAKYSIGFSGGQFKPDEYITASDFKELLSFLFFDIDGGDALITREEAAVKLVNAIGLENAAKYNDIFVQPFSDVTENKGYIAILKAMGIFSGDDSGNFNPGNNLTRGEAAVIIYKYLNR